MRAIWKGKAGRSRELGGKGKQNKALSNVLKQISGTVKEKTQAMNVKKILISNIPYFIVFYLVEKEAWLYRHCTGDSIVKKLMNMFLYFGLPFKNPVPSFFLLFLMV